MNLSSSMSFEMTTTSSSRGRVWIHRAPGNYHLYMEGLLIVAERATILDRVSSLRGRLEGCGIRLPSRHERRVMPRRYRTTTNKRHAHQATDMTQQSGLLHSLGLFFQTACEVSF